MKTSLFLLSALSFTAFANQPIEVNPQITDAVTSNKTGNSAENPDIETIVVTADFRQADLMQIPSAITVVSDDDIQNRSADHLETILSLAPNVNFASGSSRARFFQIRGIGERSQFIDPVNPSVGLIIDGIDMTGLGGAATLFDIEQVEILRGPQGTAFGANALAGAINIKSKQPTEETEGYLSAKLGNYNTQGLGGAISGSLTDDVQARFAINQTKTDGYMNNIHLNRKDTNNIDEIVARAQLNWQINDENEMHFSAFKTDINNGYDAFSLDNNRNTYSNKPGIDTQDTTALAANWTNNFIQAANLEINLSRSETKATYSYDEDWAFGEYTWMDDSVAYTPDPCDISQGPCLADFDGYSSTDEYLRDSQRSNIDIRLTSTPEGSIFNESTQWVIGIYNLNQNDKLLRNYTWDPQFNSRYKQTSNALYTELNTNINANMAIKYGLRGEQRKNTYTDSNTTFSENTENLWGGKITLEKMINSNNLAYGSIARGYKAGGVNSDPDVDEANRTFKTEINNTLELGLKSNLLDETLSTQVVAFYIERKDQQVKSSYSYQNPDNSISFQDYLANAAEGRNYGLEIESSWDITETVNWSLNMGYLDTEFTDYTYTNDNGTFTKNGREQAHAPNYSLSNKINYQISNALSFNFEIEAKDDFYFSDSHDEKSQAYTLFHGNVKYQLKQITIVLSGQNLTNEGYFVRGFGGFGNDPRNIDTNGKYIANTYTQLGNPRLITLSARYDF